MRIALNSIACGGGAELPRVEFVLGLEDRLAGGDEGSVEAALLVLEALLDDREVEDVDQLLRPGAPSFFSATAMPRAWTWRAIQRLKRSWSAALIVEAGLVFPAGEVVGLDRVEALAGAHRDPRPQRRGEEPGSGGRRASARRGSLRSGCR